jgi:hypothetical protein
VPAYFTLVNLASLRALLNLVRGDRIDRWIPERVVTPASTNGRTANAGEPATDVPSETSPPGAAVA